MSSDLTLAESAFVNAVVKVILAQVEVVEAAERVQAADAQATTANEAVFKERGFTNDTPVPELLDAQEKYMNAAIERAELGEDHPAIQALRQQLTEMRESFAQWQAEQLSGIKGPVL